MRRAQAGEVGVGADRPRQDEQADADVEVRRPHGGEVREADPRVVVLVPVDRGREPAEPVEVDRRHRGAGRIEPVGELDRRRRLARAVHAGEEHGARVGRDRPGDRSPPDRAAPCGSRRRRPGAPCRRRAGRRPRRATPAARRSAADAGRGSRCARTRRAGRAARASRCELAAPRPRPTRRAPAGRPSAPGDGRGRSAPPATASAHAGSARSGRPGSPRGRRRCARRARTPGRRADARHRPPSPARLRPRAVRRRLQLAQPRHERGPQQDRRAEAARTPPVRVEDRRRVPAAEATSGVQRARGTPTSLTLSARIDSRYAASDPLPLAAQRAAGLPERVGEVHVGAGSDRQPGHGRTVRAAWWTTSWAIVAHSAARCLPGGADDDGTGWVWDLPVMSGRIGADDRDSDA